MPECAPIAQGHGLSYVTHVYAWHDDLTQTEHDLDTDEQAEIITTLMDDLEKEVNAGLPDGAEWRPHARCIVGPQSARLTSERVNALLSQARAAVSSRHTLLSGGSPASRPGRGLHRSSK